MRRVCLVAVDLAGGGAGHHADGLPVDDEPEGMVFGGDGDELARVPQAELGLELNPAAITVPSGERVEVDGADVGRTVLAECWAHQGPPKSAQKHKVLADAFKLAWIATTLYPQPQLILCLSDPLAAAPFLPGARSWASRALQDHRITVSVVSLPEGLRQRLLEAQHRQYR